MAAAKSVPKVIYAAEQYIKLGAGNSAKFPLVPNIVASVTLGVSLGLVWKTWHWNSKRKIAQFYHELAIKETAEEQAWKESMEEKLRSIVANLDA